MVNRPSSGQRLASLLKGCAGWLRQGELIAAFDGEHGWFWRNRGDKAVTITVKVSGQYQDIKQKK
jgi:hypothetical protein